MTTLEGYVSTMTAAIKLGRSLTRVNQLIAKDRLEVLKTPLGRLVKIESINRLLAERKG